MATARDTLTLPVKKYLESKYYDPSFPGSFSGIDRFFKAVKEEGVYDLNKNDIAQWLMGEDAYTINKPVRHKFKRNRVIVSGIDNQWDGDLMDMISLSKYNQNYKYILLMIDIFSRYIWTVPLKSKHASEIIRAFKIVFKTGRKPEILRTDRGREFIAKSVTDFLRGHSIHSFVTNNIVKANYAERGIKSIKSKLSRYMYSNQTYKYIDVLDSIVETYNNSFHSSIKMAPQDVNETNESKLWRQLYLPKKEKNQPKEKSKKKTIKPYKFIIGDTVRVSFLKKTFSREYDQKWSDEIFIISKRFRRDNIPVYKLTDFYGKQNIQGTFYQEELQKISVPPNKTYKIDKILKTKTVKGQRFFLVKWMGWPSEFNSYVSAKEVKRLKGLSKKV